MPSLKYFIASLIIWIYKLFINSFSYEYRYLRLRCFLTTCYYFIFFSDNSFICFNAYSSIHRLTFPLHTPTNVVYDKFFFNFGNAYNPSNGYFTAPSAGMYIFTWTSVVAPGKMFDAEILLNGKRKGLGNCNNLRGSWYENCANTVPLVLNAGDKVNIRTCGANYLLGLWSSFKGWKV